MPETTKAQVVIKQGYKTGQAPLSSYAKIRRMRKDPTISLVRLLFFAGIIESDWSVEVEDSAYDDAADYIHQQIMPSRRHILSKAALGCFDFGWQPFEKIFAIENGNFVLKKLKPLLQDITTIIEDEDTGQFLGFQQDGKDLPLEKSLLFNFDVEGTNWEGESIMSNMEMPYDAAVKLNGAAERFDEKMAGAHWIVKYPDGESTFNGVTTPNHEIADDILAALRSSGSIAIPMGKAMFQDIGVNDPNTAWSIELITASGATFPFADRFSYLDKLKVRGAGFPERSILEGEFGTKAEAAAHADFVITMIEYRHAGIVETINWHLVNQMLRYQYGASYENKVTIKPAPLNDSKREMLRNLYDRILSNPDGFVREVEAIDVDAVADALGVPRLQEIDDVVQP